MPRFASDPVRREVSTSRWPSRHCRIPIRTLDGQVSYERLEFPRPLYPDGSDGLRLSVRVFLREQEFDPRCDSRWTGFDSGFSRRLGARGWLGMGWPERYGGGDGSPMDRHVVIEELLAAGAPLAAHWVGDSVLGPLLLRYGTEEQKERLLPAIARGDRYFCEALPEGGATSSSVVVRRGDGGFRVTGSEISAFHAHRAHYLLMPAPRGHRGALHFIVDLASPGVAVRPSGAPIGPDLLCAVALHDVLVPDAMVIACDREDGSRVVAVPELVNGGPEDFLGAFPLLRQTVEVAPAGNRHAAEEIGRLTARLWALRRLSLSVAGADDAGASPALEGALVEALGARFERDVERAARTLARPLAGGPLAELLSQAVLSVPRAMPGGISGTPSGIARGIRATAEGSAAGTAADVFGRHCSPELLRGVEPGGWLPDLWRELEASGLAGAGVALPMAEAARVVRTAAASAAPVPLAEAVLVGWLRGVDAPPGPLTVIHGGRASYGRMAAALLSSDGFVTPAAAGLEPAVNLAGEPLDRVTAPDAAGDDVRRLGALIRTVQMAGAMERVLELAATYAQRWERLGAAPARLHALRGLVSTVAGEVAGAATSVEHALEFPGEFEVAAAKVRCGEAAEVAAAMAHQLHGAVGSSGEDELSLYTRRLWSWREDFGDEADWAQLLGRAVLAEPGLLWGHAPARGTD